MISLVYGMLAWAQGRAAQGGQSGAILSSVLLPWAALRLALGSFLAKPLAVGAGTAFPLPPRRRRGDQGVGRRTGFLVSAWMALHIGGTAPAQALSPGEAVTITLRENPEIKAARAKWEMMRARVPQAGAWEDLRVGVDSVAARFIGIPPNSFMNQTLTAEQALPLSGINRSRARAATAEAGAAFEEWRRVELDAVARTRASYARLANAYAQREVNRRNQELLDQVVRISRARYESGAGSQADVLLAQTDAVKLLEARADLDRGLSEGQSALNVLMNRPAQAPLGPLRELRFTARRLPLEKLQALALLHRPEVQRTQSRVVAAAFQVEGAHRQWFPDPTLNVRAQRYNEAGEAVSELDVGVSIPIPWLNREKYRAGIVEAQKNREGAQREFEAARTEALGLVRDQVTKIQASASQYELYRDQILPLARQAVEASRAAYESATGGFLELITARRNLQDAESTALGRLADHEAALAELDAAVGTRTPDQTLEGSSK